MSIIRIETPDGRTKGWQARATVAKGFGYLSRLCSDGVHGGKRKARAAAELEEARLKRQAKRRRRELGL
jgi:hypothetical protein